MYTYYIYFFMFFLFLCYNVFVQFKGVIQNMFVLKKDLEKYKDMYKYSYLILDKLIRYSLMLLKDNIKDNEYLNNLIIDVKKLLILMNSLVINNENHFNDLFKENEKYILINNDNSVWKDIKKNYDLLAKLFIK